MVLFSNFVKKFQILIVPIEITPNDIVFKTSDCKYYETQLEIPHHTHSYSEPYIDIIKKTMD